MADSWQTIEQAAVSLGLSVRTVNRHITAGKLQSRLSDGRREVLVTVPDIATASATGDLASATRSAASSDTSAPAAADAFVTEHHADSHGGVDAETVLALADSAAQKAEMAVAAYQALARVADTQVQQVRRSARFAWAAVAIMTLGVTAAVGWTTHRLTRASVEIDHLEAQLAAGAQTVQTLSAGQEALRGERIASEQSLRTEFTARQDALHAERAAAEQTLRGELAAARQEAAKAEGMLAAYRERESDRQATETVLTASDTSPEPAPRESATADEPQAKPRPATTRPSTPSRRVRPGPTTRSAPVEPDTWSASTADQR